LVDVSVVTPTRGNPDLVHAGLRSLNRAIEAAGRSALSCEVLVVDDSMGADAAEIQTRCVEFGFTYVRGPRDVGAKRNLGARNAKGRVVIFVDSDCQAADDLLVEHADAHDSSVGRMRVVAGLTIFDPAPNGAEAVPSLSMVYEAFTAAARSPTLSWATTSNLSVRRDEFLEMGGFDESPWTHVGGEDVEFCLRVVAAAGAEILSRPGAVVRHARPPLLGCARKLFTYGRADNWLCNAFPTHERLVLNPMTIAGACGVLALSSRSRSPAALLAAAVLVGDVVGEVRRRSRLHVRARRHRLAAAAMLDWAYDMGVLFGAIRQRRLRGTLTEFRY